MAWVSPTNVATGDVLTASKWNQEVVENTRLLRGDFAISRYTTASSIVYNSTAWTNLSGPSDLVLAAAADDVVQVSVSFLWGNEATDAFIDVVTMISSTVTNSFATGGAVNASGQGIIGWRGSNGAFASIGGTHFYKLVSGDISSSTVTLRLRVRSTNAVNKTVFGASGSPIVFSAINHGPVEI
jgi:hypothetical protein